MSRFFFLRFSDYYIKTVIAKDKEAIKRMEYILQNASHRPGCILKNKADKPLINTLVESIIQEKTNQQIYYNKIIEQIVNTMITIVARNIALKLPKNIKESTGEPVLEILHYILKGSGTKEIAETLNLKMNTVSTMKNRIYEKTNAGNIKELIELATLYNVNY